MLSRLIAANGNLLLRHRWCRRGRRVGSHARISAEAGPLWASDEEEWFPDQQAAPALWRKCWRKSVASDSGSHA